MHQKVRWLVRTYAARKFQAAWRQTIARDRFIVAKDGMILLQAVARGRRGRKIVRALHQAAALIQATYRMHEIRDAVSTLGGHACVCGRLCSLRPIAKLLQRVHGLWLRAFACWLGATF